ncbi:alpha/beta fold hydrolase [Candidatus Woesearchaeota archaeon]|nr:alpha/beta fold hydrolase [Candidatus Woesearchaeota archaeon]
MKKEISFKNNKGQTLMGDLYIPENKYKLKFPTVIVCHGIGGNKDEYNKVDLAETLYNEGFIALKFDFAGRGKSEGKFEDITLSQQATEISSAIDAAYSLPQVDKKEIGLVGHSFGGSAAIMAATKDRRIKSLVTISAAYDKTKAIKILVGTQGFKNWKKNGVAGMRLNDRKENIKYTFWEDVMKHNMLSYIKRIKIPFLVVHGEKDKLIGVNQAKAIAKAANAQLRIASDEGHAFNKKSIKFIIDWFKKTLR